MNLPMITLANFYCPINRLIADANGNLFGTTGAGVI